MTQREDETIFYLRRKNKQTHELVYELVEEVRRVLRIAGCFSLRPAR
jgi:predicted nucleic acid-binding protein